MSRSNSPVRVHIMSDSDGEEMNSEHVLNDLSTQIVNDILPPETEADLVKNFRALNVEAENREHRPSPEDLTAEEKHGSPVELPVINDPMEAIAGIISTPIVPVVIDEDAPEVPAIDGRDLSPEKEHLVVEEDDHKSHEVEDGEPTKVEDEVPLENYEEPEPQKAATPPLQNMDNAGEEDITAVVHPETTMASEEHFGDGTEGLSNDIHISDVVNQALNDPAPVQILVEDSLPPPDTEQSPPITESVPTQILVEDVDAADYHEKEEKSDEEMLLDSTQEYVPSPPQNASREHSPIQISDEGNDLKKRSIESSPESADIPVETTATSLDDAVHQSSPMKEDSPATAFAKDMVPVQIEDNEKLAPLNLDKESSPPAIIEPSHTEILIDNTSTSAEKEFKQPSPPIIQHVEDKAEEDVIVPKIVAHEEEETKTTVTSSHHVKPIDITPLPEDEPIPVGIPEVRTIETVKEEKENSKKAQKGSTSSEDDKQAGPKRQEGFVTNIRKRCAIL